MPPTLAKAVPGWPAASGRAGRPHGRAGGPALPPPSRLRGESECPTAGRAQVKRPGDSAASPCSPGSRARVTPSASLSGGHPGRACEIESVACSRTDPSHFRVTFPSPARADPSGPFRRPHPAESHPPGLFRVLSESIHQNRTPPPRHSKRPSSMSSSLRRRRFGPAGPGPASGAPAAGAGTGKEGMESRAARGVGERLRAAARCGGADASARQRRVGRRRSAASGGG